MNSRLTLSILFSAACLWTGQAHAGAWSQAKGGYYAKFSGIFYNAGEAFDGQGNRQSRALDETFDSRQGFFYLEYGLKNRLTLITSLSAGRLASETTQSSLSTSALGDLGIGAKYQITDGPVVLAPYVMLKLPTGYDEADVPAIGTGDPDFEVRMLAARSLYPTPLYLGVELGLRLRSGRFSNQVPYTFEVGATPNDRLFFKIAFDGVNTLIGSGGNTAVMDSMSNQVSEGDFVKVGFNAAFNVAGNAWIDVSYDTVFSGKNVGAGSSFGIGLSISR